MSSFSILCCCSLYSDGLESFSFSRDELITWAWKLRAVIGREGSTKNGCGISRAWFLVDTQGSTSFCPGCGVSSKAMESPSSSFNGGCWPEIFIWSLILLSAGSESLCLELRSWNVGISPGEWLLVLWLPRLRECSRRLVLGFES